MDKGHGLLDGFLISVPVAWKPTPQEKDAIEYLVEFTFKFEPIPSSISAAHKGIIRTYTLSPVAEELHHQIKMDYVNEEVCSEFVKNIVEPAKEKLRMQPTAVDNKAAVLHFSS
ncbi:hypothetical protein ACROYT_G014558 [Oculina patagonica]